MTFTQSLLPFFLEQSMDPATTGNSQSMGNTRLLFKEFCRMSMPMVSEKAILQLPPSCSVSINSCKPEPVKLLLEATLKTTLKAMLKATNGQNSCTGWASACIKEQLK